VDYVTYFVQVFKVLPYITTSKSVHREECITYMTQSAFNDDISVSSLYIDISSGFFQAVTMSNQKTNKDCLGIPTLYLTTLMNDTIGIVLLTPPNLM